MAENATILIPDISGYTEFLTKTELVHSSHIITELLEAILAANGGDFVLSEVEGDALLLYHKGKPLEADALVRQCLSMFESFHKQIKIIERDSLCQCGACKTASNLTLKFIAHHGMVQEIKVMQFTKCSGLDMVVAHRLLKNRIGSDEYNPRALSRGSDRARSTPRSGRSTTSMPSSPGSGRASRIQLRESARWSSSGTTRWQWRSTRRCWRSISW